MKKIIREDDKIPKGYAVSYLSTNSFSVVCYPIGIHWVMFLLRKFYTWVRVGTIEKSEFVGFAKGFSKGEKKGYNKGYDNGFKKGEKDGIKDLIAIRKTIRKIRKTIEKKK